MFWKAHSGLFQAQFLKAGGPGMLSVTKGHPLTVGEEGGRVRYVAKRCFCYNACQGAGKLWATHPARLKLG